MNKEMLVFLVRKMMEGEKYKDWYLDKAKQNEELINKNMELEAKLSELKRRCGDE